MSVSTLAFTKGNRSCPEQDFERYYQSFADNAWKKSTVSIILLDPNKIDSCQLYTRMGLPWITYWEQSTPRTWGRHSTWSISLALTHAFWREILTQLIQWLSGMPQMQLRCVKLTLKKDSFRPSPSWPTGNRKNGHIERLVSQVKSVKEAFIALIDRIRS